MKSKFILLLFGAIVVLSSAFTSTKDVEVKLNSDHSEFIVVNKMTDTEVVFTPIVTMTTVTFSYTKMFSDGPRLIEETFTVKESEYLQFAENWYKEHNIIKKIDAYCCQTVYDEDVCACIETCCTWMGAEVGTICSSRTVDCAGAPQVPCD